VCQQTDSDDYSSLSLSLFLVICAAGPANYLSLLVNSARMEGFVLFDYIPEYPVGT
jgi:hypothetical protein